jgi:cytidylate kinase
MNNAVSKTVPIITLDGPSGTGKGTTAKILANRLKWHLLDSGLLYRALALAAKLHAIDVTNDDALAVLAEHLDVQFTSESGMEHVTLEGNDVTDDIRMEECGQLASTISAAPTVRQALLNRQRAFAISPGLITDGRDMGTVVFPDALLKIYLQASVAERVQRRYRQLKDKGINVSLAQLEQDLRQRDLRDQNRSVAPMRPASDAIIIDTTELNIDQVVNKILTLLRPLVEHANDVV